MTSRRGTLVEDGARELLQVHGYNVRVIPPGFNRQYPPVHLVAAMPSGEMRFIRIWKLSRQPSTIETIERKCSGTVSLFRKHQSKQSGKCSVHYEIWIYTLSYGFRCFEVLMDSIREIPKFSPTHQSSAWPGGVA